MVAAALAVATMFPIQAQALETCSWEARLQPASNDDGHRVWVVFTEFDSERVKLSVDQEAVLDRVLSIGVNQYSGSVQCRLEGFHWFHVTVDGQKASLRLNVDEPQQIYVSGSDAGIMLAVFEGPLEGLLLD